MSAFENWKNKIKNMQISRTEFAKTNWYTINNTNMLDLYGKCKGELKYSAENLENWKDMFRVINNNLNECYYINDIIRLFFDNSLKGSLSVETRKANDTLLKIRDWMDSEADTIIFVPIGNNGRDIFATMLKATVGENYNIHILDKNNTTNTECEENSVVYSENARKNLKKCIFVSSMMENCSWPNPYIKNCILLVNNPSYDNICQKIAKTLTPWTDCNGKLHDTACIFDFRLQYNDITPAEKYITDTLKQKGVYSDKEISEIIEKIESSDKIAFFDTYNDIENSLHKLSKDEIRRMI